MRKITGVVVLLILVLSFPVLTPGCEDTLQFTEYQLAGSNNFEEKPILGNDGISDLVVFTIKPGVLSQITDGSWGVTYRPGDVWYQRLDADGAPSDPPVQVTSSAKNEEANDMYGDYIIYTAYDSINSASGTIMLYQISTQDVYPLVSAEYIICSSIYDHYVVWNVRSEERPFWGKVMLYDINWIGTLMEPITIAGPEPSAFFPRIDSRFVVWLEIEAGQHDICVYDLEDSGTFNLTNTNDISEQSVATNGSWVAWETGIPDTGLGYCSFIYDDNTCTTFKVPLSDDTNSYGINDAGTIVGDYYSSSSGRQCLIYDGFTYTTFDVRRSDQTRALGINDAGTVVGNCWESCTTRIEAINLASLEKRVVADNGAYNNRPSIDGDFITWDSQMDLFFNIFVYRISTGETFQLTTDPGYHYVSDVFGNLVAFMVLQSGSTDIYVSKLEFNITPSEQLDNILTFFDTSVDNGTLTGSGPGKSAENRLNALRNMIETAADLIDDGLIDEARQLLFEIYKKCDGQPYPSDLVSGPAAAELANLIQELLESLED